MNNFLVPIVTFELLDSAITTELVYDFNDVKHILLQQTIPEQITNLGYETHNSILNLGSTYLFVNVYAIFVVILLLLKYRLKNYGIRRKIHNFLQEKLIFSFIIQLFVTTFMESLIAGYLNLRA